MQYLPSFLCHIIDSVAFHGDPVEWRQPWNDWKEQYEEYFERESDHALSDEDQQLIANLPPMLNQLDDAVHRAFDGQGDLEHLVEKALTFFQAHDTFYEAREKRFFVPSQSLDRLLKAGVAHLQDRADYEAVQKRAPEAALAVSVLSDMYVDTEKNLPEELKKGLLDGFSRAQKGFDLLAAEEDPPAPEVLEEALFEIRSAGELLEHLPALVRRFEEENSYAIPLLGTTLSSLQHQESEELWERLITSDFPALLALWEQRQDGWLLHPDAAPILLEDAAHLLTALAAQLETVPPERPEQFWTTVEQLEEVFLQIQDQTLELEELQASPYWPEAQLILNMLRGGAPIYAARTLIDGVRAAVAPKVITEISNLLEQHLETGDPLPLLHALVALLEDLELSKTTLPCSACGDRVPLEAKSCPECGAAVEELSISG